eukprot:763677-Hanusia_phi.AAC.3
MHLFKLRAAIVNDGLVAEEVGVRPVRQSTWSAPYRMGGCCFAKQGLPGPGGSQGMTRGI